MDALDFAALILRLVIGTTFLIHSLTFLGVLRAEPGHVSGIGQTLEAFGPRMGFRWPRLMVALVVGGEGVGALLCLLGFVQPLPCFIFALIIFQGIWMRRSHGFTLEQGIEHHVNLGVAVIALAALGAGSVSIDGLLGWDDTLSGPWWGVGVAAAAAAAAAVFQAVMRR